MEESGRGGGDWQMRGRKRINNLSSKIGRETSSSSTVIQLNNLSVESENGFRLGHEGQGTHVRGLSEPSVETGRR